MYQSIYRLQSQQIRVLRLQKGVQVVVAYFYRWGSLQAKGQEWTYSQMGKKLISKGVGKKQQQRDEISIHQQAFACFLEGLSNADMVHQSQNLKNCSISALLRPAVEIVVDQVEKIAGKATPFQKEEIYSERREKVIVQIVGRRRWIFHGRDSNSLGESTLKNFIRLCEHYFTEGNLGHFDQGVLMKIFRRWFYPGRQHMITRHLPRQDEGNEEFYELRRKQRQMEALRIEHQILKKQSEMLATQRQIQELQRNIKQRKGGSSVKVEEEPSDDEEQQEEHSKTQQQQALTSALQQSKESLRSLQARKTLLVPPLVKAQVTTQIKSHLSLKGQPIEKSQAIIKHNTRREVRRLMNEPTQKIVEESKVDKKKDNRSIRPTKSSSPLEYVEQRSDKQESVHKKKRETVKAVVCEQRPKEQRKPAQTVDSIVKNNKWTHEEEKALIDFSVAKGKSTKIKVSAEMIKRFGDSPKYQSGTISDKKLGMLSKTRRLFLIELQKRALLSPSQFKVLASHFQSVDNRHSLEFISKFLQIFYFCEIGTMPNKVFLDTVSQVYKQKTKVLSETYSKKKHWEKDRIDTERSSQMKEGKEITAGAAKIGERKVVKEPKGSGKPKISHKNQKQSKERGSTSQKERVQTQQGSPVKQQESDELSKEQKQLNLKQTVRGAFLGMINS